MTAGRIIAIVVGAVLGFVAVGLMATGGFLSWAYAVQRGPDGFITSADHELSAAGYAITSDRVDLHADPVDRGWAPGTDASGGGWRIGGVDVRLRAATPEGTGAIFVGIGPAANVAAYLDGAAYSEVTDIRPGATVAYRAHEGTGSQPAAPTDQDFWVVSAAGTGPQQVTWDVATGAWTAVIMNADGSAGVLATTSAGIHVAFLLPLLIGVFVAAFVVLVLAATLLVVGTRGAHEPTDTVPGQPGAAAALGTTAGRYPVMIEAQLDPGLSRWQWLVKWFLAIPHYIVLGFLWLAFSVLTVVAGFAILFTGRYPRGIFDFNVGVLRWTWRVTYYSTSVLGTDRYPPFTLAPVDYPASFDVAYPESLSRGLVLVKWWLLAIPHYIVVGLLAGNLFSWTFPGGTNRNWEFVVGGGLIGDAQLHRRGRARVRRHLPARAVRPADGAQPVGLPGRGLRGAHAGRVPAVPPRHGRQRAAGRPAAATAAPAERIGRGAHAHPGVAPLGCRSAAARPPLRRAVRLPGRRCRAGRAMSGGRRGLGDRRAGRRGRPPANVGAAMPVMRHPGERAGRTGWPGALQSHGFLHPSVPELTRVAGRPRPRRGVRRVRLRPRRALGEACPAPVQSPLTRPARASARDAPRAVPPPRLRAVPSRAARAPRRPAPRRPALPRDVLGRNRPDRSEEIDPGRHAGTRRSGRRCRRASRTSRRRPRERARNQRRVPRSAAPDGVAGGVENVSRRGRRHPSPSQAARRS